MNSRLLSYVLLVSVMGLFAASCAGRASDETIPVTDPDEVFLARPQFHKAVDRPLGRILLSWDAIEGAKGYQIQMSDTADFSRVAKNWTINSVSLELPVEPGTTAWFRLRAFNGDTTGRWSPILEVTEGRQP